MKVKLIRPATTLNPQWSSAEAARCRDQGKKYDVSHSIPREAGYVIDHPDAWKLIRAGYAEPEDDESRERAGLTPAQIQAAIKGQDKIQEDYQKAVAKSRKKRSKKQQAEVEQTEDEVSAE